MRSSKFPHSAELFKFSHRILSRKQNRKVNDQNVGSILGFNPSDCSHWKRGKKNVRSVFALEKLAAALGVEISLIYDVISGDIDVDEGLYEYGQSLAFKQSLTSMRTADPAEVEKVRTNCVNFIAELHRKSEFAVPPLYLPEVLVFFPFINSQAFEMVDRLSRILRINPGQYVIQFRRGDLKSQTRMSIISDLSKIILQGERDKFPELGKTNEKLLKFEQHLFVAEMLVPKQTLKQEMQHLDSRKNIISELAATFWVPKSLISFQLQDILRTQAPEAELAPVNRSLADETIAL